MTPSVCFREDPEKLTLSPGGLPGAPRPGRTPSVVLSPRPPLPCPHILDQSRHAAGALRSKAHWGLSSGVFKKEETKGSEAGPQVRSPAGAAARTTEGNRQVPAELRAPGPAATPAGKFRLPDRGSRSASSGQDPAPPGRAALIQTSLGGRGVQESLQSWSRGYLALGVSR
nr:uncharacterized protein LOC112133762 [Pongo abelii]